jgi:hypothetical protein
MLLDPATNSIHEWGFRFHSLYFSGDYGTDYGWLFILIGIILVVGSTLEAIAMCDANGGCFAAGYILGLFFIH